LRTVHPCCAFCDKPPLPGVLSGNAHLDQRRTNRIYLNAGQTIFPIFPIGPGRISGSSSPGSRPEPVVTRTPPARHITIYPARDVASQSACSIGVTRAAPIDHALFRRPSAARHIPVYPAGWQAQQAAPTQNGQMATKLAWHHPAASPVGVDTARPSTATAPARPGPARLGRTTGTTGITWHGKGRPCPRHSRNRAALRCLSACWGGCGECGCAGTKDPNPPRCFAI
jgi:hypothetical protein